MSLWDNFLKDITEEFKNKENFLKGNTIRRCLHPAINSMTALKYFNEVNHLDFLKQDPQTGNPTYCIDKFSLVTLQSSLYLKTMLKKSKLDTIDEIHDIGGGYGNMAWTLKNYGYDKKYIIYDFPIMHDIQKYWLGKQNIKVEYKSLDELDPGKNSHLIGTHSINEMDLSDREKIPFNKFKSFFIAHNKIFNGIDNVKYFRNLVKKLDHTTEHLFFGDDDGPLQASHYWLTGIKP
tara:strand:+ start:132 stop:836 length:705 start_codon:yes stop_codon:yes gene_type:complete